MAGNCCRKEIGKKKRMEVFKRDSFTCQYCGRKAPDVILEVDHIVPVVEGGGNDILNLITSCRDCNRGKGATRLNDGSVVAKRMKQAGELQERREQIEMVAEWQGELIDQDKLGAKKVAEIISQSTGGAAVVSNTGISNLQKIVSKYGLGEAMIGAQIAFCQYPHETAEEMEKAFGKIPGICHNRRYPSCKTCLFAGARCRDGKTTRCLVDGKLRFNYLARKCGAYKCAYDDYGYGGSSLSA